MMEESPSLVRGISYEFDVGPLVLDETFGGIPAYLDTVLCSVERVGLAEDGAKLLVFQAGRD